MALKEPLSKGDWIEATAKNGSQIIGQAQHDMSTSGFAALKIVLGGDNESLKIIEINVNYWDVVVLRKNLLGGENQ